MRNHLNAQQITDWQHAVQAVEEVATNTDTESGSKLYIDTMARFVRDEPDGVVRLLALV